MGNQHHEQLNPLESQHPSDSGAQGKSLYNYDKAALDQERNLRRSENHSMSSVHSGDGILIAQASDIYGQRGDGGLRPPWGEDSSDIQWQAFLTLQLKRAKDPNSGIDSSMVSTAMKTLHDDNPDKFDRVMRDLAKENPTLIKITPADGKPHVTKVESKEFGHSTGQVLYQ